MISEVIVFTKEMMIRKEDAKTAAIKAGHKAQSRVTKTTTILVVGDQDEYKYPDNKKTENQKKANKLISQGQNIRVFTETDFIRLIEKSTEPA